MAMLLIIAALAFAVCPDAGAQNIIRKKELKNDSIRAIHIPKEEFVTVGNDTVSMIIPERNFGRYDRGLYNYLFIPRGKWSFGLTASYGELNTDDIRVLSVLKNIDFNGKQYALRPYLGYNIRDNQTIGIRFNYTKGTADLGRLALDFDDDLSFDIKNVSYHTQSFGISAYYRNYVGLSMAKRFAVFNEVELAFASGASYFRRYYNDELRNTRTLSAQGSLNFSPGVCVFLQDNISFCVSFGVFGLNFKNEKQSTNGVEEGSRFSSGANFRFNIFNINFGLMVVI